MSGPGGGICARLCVDWPANAKAMPAVNTPHLRIDMQGSFGALKAAPR
jgi:hypothetical protein